MHDLKVLFKCDIISTSTPGCTYFSAIIHMWMQSCLYEYICIKALYMYVGDECTCTGVWAQVVCTEHQRNS